MKRKIGEYQEVQPYMYGDFYALTPYTLEDTTWAGWQLNRPDKQDGCVVLLKRGSSLFTAMNLGLHHLDPNATYEVETRHSLEKDPPKKMKGSELANLRVDLPGRPDSEIIFYHQKITVMNSPIYPGLGNLMKLSDAQTRSVSAENVYGEKGVGGMARMEAGAPEDVARIGQVWKPNRSSRELGTKWKVRPCILLPPESTTTIMDVSGPGVIQHMWITVDDKFWRDLILRISWDDEATPSVEVPLGDFFCNGWRKRTNINSMPISVNPSGGFNSYFPMPFRQRARVTIENRSPHEVGEFFYTINYALTPVADDDAYFHAQFRRINPVKYGEDVAILEAKGKGHYVGTFLAWQQNSAAWWGEGEFKVFLDGDGEWPTICGTGTEDYFGGAWCFRERKLLHTFPRLSLRTVGRFVGGQGGLTASALSLPRVGSHSLS